MKKIFGPHRKSGRPTTEIADSQKRWGCSLRHARRYLSYDQQLENCKDDSARRLLLGISEKVRP